LGFNPCILFGTKSIVIEILLQEAVLLLKISTLP
jgi:hypothetical protein